MQVFKIGKKATLKLMLGDLVVLFAALLFSLILRAGELPRAVIVGINAYAFAPVFFLWILGFYVYNLYGRITVSAAKNFGAMLFQACTFNTILAVLFFYLVPVRGVTPKTTLLLIFLFSYVFMYLWRMRLLPLFSPRQSEVVLIVGKRPEHEEILNELNAAASMNITASLCEEADSSGLKAEVRRLRAKVIVADVNNPRTQELFSSFSPEELLSLKFVNPGWLYEELFGRIPLSHVTNVWLFSHITYEQRVYDAAKRIIDIIISAVIGILSLVIYPFAALAIKLEDKGPVFIRQIRIGKGMKPIKIIKFRTMTGDDKGSDVLKSKLKVTRVGAFLRASRIDELPQLWNIFKGDLSMVGPRPELVSLAEHYAKEIPFYHVRHLIAPGAAGWGQIHQIANATDPHHGAAIEATREKLSYDFYYLKHRSLILDIIVMLKTIKILLSKPGT